MERLKQRVKTKDETESPEIIFRFDKFSICVTIRGKADPTSGQKRKNDFTRKRKAEIDGNGTG